MRYFLHLAYNGSNYHGWQVQPNACTIQQEIERAISTILRHQVEIVGAGRTDTGVNAKSMYAHFNVERPIEDKQKFLNSLNRLVGRDIAIYDLIDVVDNAHARFDALYRTYKYFVAHEKNPFLYPLTWHCGISLDYDKMNTAAAMLKEYSDFTSFSKLHTDVKTNICEVTDASWTHVNGVYVFTIRANRFLRNMVRAIVGTLIEVGREKMSIEDFRDVILKKNRCFAGTSMPPHALYLWKVEYPEEIFSAKHRI